MSPAVLCFALACRFGFKLPPALAMAWWRGLKTSDDTRCRWLMRRLQRYQGTPDHYGPWFTRAIPAKALVLATEALHEEGRLSRPEASAIENSILALMRQGVWK